MASVQQKSRVRMLLPIGFWLLFMTIFSPPILAEEINGMGFSYYNVKVDNPQKTGSYFDLLVEPNQEQELKTVIKNESSERIIVKISINDATTTHSGVIDYGPTKLKNLSSLAYKMSELLTGPEEVTLEKGEIKTVTFKLKVPEAAFQGVLLGGVQLERVTKKAEKKGPASVQNKYAYVYSISLREEVEPLPYEISFGKTTYIENGEQQEVRVTINNDSQEIMTGMSLSICLREKDSPEVLMEEKVTDMKMAPKSEMIYPLKLTPVKAGHYMMEALIEANGKQWRWEDDFEISDKDEVTAEIDQVRRRKFSFQQMLIIVISLIVGTLVIYVGIKLVS